MPIYFGDIGNKPDFALAITQEEDGYVARTILTLEMAIMDARIIRRPQVNWLKL